MSDTDVILLTDDTFEGMLTAVFDSYSYSPPPTALESAACYQPQLGAVYHEVTTDEHKAARVITGVRQKMGQIGYQKIWQAFLYEDPAHTAPTAIYHYIRHGMRVGMRIHQQLTDPRVMAIDKMCALTGREASMMIEFVRFSECEGGVYYAEIDPTHPILPLIMPHFAARFHVQPFLIHDMTHHMAGLSDRHGWYCTSTEGLRVPAMSADEAAYRRMWRTFYDTIAIKERINPNLRRQHMPKKYWKHLTEMQSPDEPSPALPFG